MRYRKTMIISTVAVFVLASVLSFVWLFRVRRTEISATYTDESGAAVYDYAEGVINGCTLGKSVFFVDLGALKDKLEENAYLRVDKLEKVYPDKIYAEIGRREEKFAIKSGEYYYLTDENFVFLGKTADVGFFGDKVVPVTVENTEIDLSSAVAGKKTDFGGEALLGYMLKIFDGIDGGERLISSVTVNGDKYGANRNRIYFATYTGVTFEFRFSYDGEISDEEKILSARLGLCDSVAALNEKFASLDEKQKSEGYIAVYLKDDLSVAVDYYKGKKDV